MHKKLTQETLVWYLYSMQNKQRFLPGMNHVLCGRPPKTSLARLEAKLCHYRESSLSELMSVFGSWIPFQPLQPKAGKANSRCRDYSLSVTFWAFLWQVLTPGTACREVVRKIQSFGSEMKLRIPSSNNAAFCKARARMAKQDLEAIHSCILDRILSRVRDRQRWLGHNVKVVDGTGIRLPGTERSQT